MCKKIGNVIVPTTFLTTKRKIYFGYKILASIDFRCPSACENPRCIVSAFVILGIQERTTNLKTYRNILGSSKIIQVGKLCEMLEILFDSRSNREKPFPFRI